MLLINGGKLCERIMSASPWSLYVHYIRDCYLHLCRTSSFLSISLSSPKSRQIIPSHNPLPSFHKYIIDNPGLMVITNESAEQVYFLFLFRNFFCCYCISLEYLFSYLRFIRPNTILF